MMNEKVLCRLMNMSSQELEKYRENGLLDPSMQELQSGNYYYDDKAVRKLTLIRGLVQCGYPENRIKELLDRPETKTAGEYEPVIQLLTEQRKRINDLILELKIRQACTRIPEDMRQIITTTVLPDEESFLDSMKDTLKTCPDAESWTEEEVVINLPLLYHFLAIGGLRQQMHTPGSREARKYALRTVDYLKSISRVMFDEEDIPETQIRSSAFRMIFLQLDKAKSFIDQRCGNGTTAYIREVFNQLMPEIKKRQHA